MTKQDIRENWRKGLYPGVNPEHAKAYMDVGR